MRRPGWLLLLGLLCCLSVLAAFATATTLAQQNDGGVAELLIELNEGREQRLLELVSSDEFRLHLITFVDVTGQELSVQRVLVHLKETRSQRFEAETLVTQIEDAIEILEMGQTYNVNELENLIRESLKELKNFEIKQEDDFSILERELRAP